MPTREASLSSTLLDNVLQNSKCDTQAGVKIPGGADHFATFLCLSRNCESLQKKVEKASSGTPQTSLGFLYLPCLPATRDRIN